MGAIFVMAFLGAIAPGPDILLVLQTALKCGFWRAIQTLLGIATGWVLYLTLLYLGLAHFLQTQAAQTTLGALGSAYLGYLGYALFTKPKNALNLGVSSDLDAKNADFVEFAKSNSTNRTIPKDSVDSAHASATHRTTQSPQSRTGGYIRGLLINLSNPKAILFFGVIVAPFMGKNLALRLAVLFSGLLSAFLLTIATAIFLRRFITNRAFDIIDRLCAVAFLGFACALGIITIRGIL